MDRKSKEDDCIFPCLRSRCTCESKDVSDNRGGGCGYFVLMYVVLVAVISLLVAAFLG